jgi:threonine dehydrogenase-like Zn-dependent dehydrogenase
MSKEKERDPTKITVESKGGKFKMKVQAVRLHAANDLRLDEFELPEITDDEILVKVVSDTICMSTYKCAILGTKHKRVHEDVAEHPAIMGHEFAGDIVKVGKNHQDKFKPGMKFTLQPALNYKGTMWSPGYSYEFFGGDATYCIIPAEVMELGCLLEYKGKAYYEASLAEPLSCSIGAMNAAYHTKMGVYHHEMGIKKGGKLAIMAGAGPMGLGALTYALHRDVTPGMVVVTDINQDRLDRAAELFPPEEVKKETGIELHFINTGKVDDPVKYLRDLTGGKGYDDVLCYAPVAPVVEQSSAILGRDGCLNFFAGPTDPNFSAKMNFYDVHYNSTHVMGTTGGNTADMIESLELTAAKRINPAVMITHLGGLDTAAETTLNLPKIPGGKKLIYTHLRMPLVALTDLRARGQELNDDRYIALADIVDAHKGLWCPEAEEYLLANFIDE